MTLTAWLVALSVLGAAPPRSGLQPVALEQAAGTRFALAFSPDGATLAAVGKTTPMSAQRLLFWGTATGKRREGETDHTLPIVALTYTLDGKALVSLTEEFSRRLTIWNTDGAFLEHRDFREFDNASGRIFALSEGRVMWCTPKAMACCSLQKARGARQFFHRVALIEGGHCGAVSSDGKLWAHLNHQDIDLYDISERKRVRSFLDHRGRVCAVAFRPDGKQLASVSHRFDDDHISHTAAHVWGVANGKRSIRVALSPGLRGTGVAFSAGGLVAIVGHDEEDSAFLRVFESASGAEVARSSFPGEAGKARDMAFSRDGKYLAVCLSEAVRLWRVSGKERP
jgi:WD40 repeat protein